VPKFLIYVVGTIGTISRDLALLACGWHVRFFADVMNIKKYILLRKLILSLIKLGLKILNLIINKFIPLKNQN
jgi:hypothetical protein